MKVLISLTLFIGILLSIFSCNKNGKSAEEIKDIDSGKFLATIDGSTWHPTIHKATYYSKYNELTVSAIENGSTSTRLWGGIDIDLTNPIKTYLLEPNGNNAFGINIKEQKVFFSNNNIADAGGTFTLTKFDTVNKKISGILQFTGYNEYQEKIKFASTVIDDLPLKIDTTNYNGNIASCTVQGASTSFWQSKNIRAFVECISGVEETLYIRINTMTALYQNGKELLFVVPLKNSKGKYQIYPFLPPYFYCGDKRMTSAFCSYNPTNMYYPTSGELNITNIDTSLRKLKATFNVQYRDTTSKGETIQVSNGTITLNTWKRMNEL